MNGDLAGLSEEIPSLLNHLTEFDKSSALHIAAMAGQGQLIHDILTRFDNLSYIDTRNLLLGPNSKGDLPIHVAVRAGKIHSVSTLLEKSASLNVVHQMLEAENNDGNTPLHIALENQQKHMADSLFQLCPHTFHRLNRLGMSPLYLAIKAAFWELVKLMLLTEVEDHGNVHRHLDKGRVVHAAIMAKNLDILKIMLDKYLDLRYSTDEKLRRPLSYAAFTGFLEGVRYLLRDNNFQNLAFRPDEDGSFPIHRACSGGNSTLVVKEFLDHSNNMMWLPNTKGQNILHVAAEAGKAKVVNYILRLPNSESLINMKDEDGNTPLHLASKGKHPKVIYALTWDDRVKLNLQNNHGLTALDVAEDYGQVPSFEERLTWLALRYAGVPRAPQIHPTTQPTDPLPGPTQGPNNGIPNGLLHIPNNTGIPNGFVVIPNNSYCTQNETPDQQMSPSNKYKERLNTLLMVSTLVATVTFASGFTVPGGYNQGNPNIGMATLAHRCAFQVFVISNTIALFSATLAMVTLIWAQLDDLRLTLLSLDFALPLLGTALAMMSVAFMAGLFVVLHTKVWLGVTVLVIGGGFLGALTVFFIPLYSPTSRIKSKLLRYIFHVPFKLMLLACERGKSETLY